MNLIFSGLWLLLLGSLIVLWAVKRFRKSSRVFLGRARTCDTNAVFTQNTSEVLPGESPTAVGQAVIDIPLRSCQIGITAHSGGGQTNAVPLTSTLCEIDTVGAANDSVILPPALAGMVMFVANAAATNSANVYPFLGDKISAGSANSPTALAAGKRVVLFCTQNGQWWTVLTA